MILFERAPRPSLVPRTAYSLNGDLYEEVYNHRHLGVVFRPLICSTTIRQWIEEKVSPLPDILLPEGRHPWLEFPFEQHPGHHPHHNHGNLHDGDPEYYFLVGWGPREFGQGGIYYRFLFVPARSSAFRVQEHLRKVFGDARLYGAMPDVVLPTAA